MDANFMILPDSSDPSKVSYINLNQIRMVNEISKGHCKIWFSENYVMEIEGDGANEITRFLGTKSITAWGVPLVEAIEEATKKAKSE